MKTNIYVYLFLLLISVFAVSCDDDEPQPPQSAAEFTASATSVKVGEEVQFTNTSENATAFRWSFGDGTTSKEVSPKKSYESSGKFLVSLVSTGAGGSTISNIEITVIPDAAFTVEDEDNLISLTPIQFTNNSRGATSYHWSFGNPAGSTSTDANPEFTYLTAGTYTVTLTATSSFGETQVSKEITVTAATSEVYFADYGAEIIGKLSLDGNSVISNFLDVAGFAGSALAYDDVHGKIYFTDFNETDAGKIWRVNLDGSELEAIASDLRDPYSIALDISGGKVYWADDEDDNGDTRISRANLDGSSKEDVVTMAGAFRAVALDAENGKMYFYEVNGEDIYVANLDGSGAAPIISGVWGYSIAIDTKNNKIYFDERNDNMLKRANLDGSMIETVDDTSDRVYGIAVDNEDDKLYWSSRDTGGIYVSGLDGSNKETLTEDLSSPRGIFLRK